MRRVGLVLSGGVLRATPTYSNSLAIGFYEDGTAFIGTPGDGKRPHCLRRPSRSPVG